MLIFLCIFIAAKLKKFIDICKFFVDFSIIELKKYNFCNKKW